MLLSDIGGGDRGWCSASSNAPVSGAALGSHDQNRGEAHATRDASVITAIEAADEQFDLFRLPGAAHTAPTPAWEALPATDARDADGADDAPHPRSRGSDRATPRPREARHES